MNPPTILLFILAVAGGLGGAWLTTLARGGGGWWLPLVGSAVVALAWAGAAKTSTTDIVVLSAWFDVVVVLAWFAGFWLVDRSSVSLTQWCGIALLCVGLALIDL